MPLENSSRAESRPNSSLEEPSPRTSPAGVVVEKPEPEPAAHDLSEKTAEGVLPASVSPEPLGPPPSAAVTDAAPPHEMVPEVSLNEYVSGFRYVLQGQAEEITTKGENPGLGREVPAPAGGPASPSAENVSTESAPAAPAEDVFERLGLEPMEDRSDRPRFLDINPPSPPPETPAMGASAIAGPSFLGLNDPVQITSEDEAVAAQTPGRAKWRVWLGVAVVLVLTALGALQWRSQMLHTNNGPVEIARTAISKLRHGESSARSPDNTGTVESPRPEVQVEEPPKPKVEDQSGANPNASSSVDTSSQAALPSTNAGSPNASTPRNATASPTSQPDTGQNAVKPSQPAAITATSPPTSQNAAPAKSTPPPNGSNTTVSKPKTVEAQVPAEKLKPKPASDEDVAIKKPVPGEEEVAKAKDASDSAAQAAWLWKATAKGNPDAPVTLANMFIKGDGVPRSCEQALVLLKSAAAKQNAPARNRLGSLYANGVCVQRNRVEAYRWFSSALAANPNSQKAQESRDLLLQQMTPEERATAEKPR